MQTNFERVRMMLDQLCPQFGLNGQQLATALATLSAGYGSLAKGTNLIDYSSAATQAAYVYKYVPAHADLIYRELQASRERVRHVFEQPVVNLLCVGGGPGTELLGVLKFKERLPAGGGQLRCRIWDRNAPWEAVIAAAAATAPAQIGVTANFDTFDWQFAGEWDAAAAVGDTDVLTLSYTLSEVWRFNGNGAVSANLNRIICALKPGAVLVYSDNSGQAFDPHFEANLLNRDDLTLLNRTDHTHMLVGSDEQMSDVADYRTWMGSGYGTMCKLTGQATCAAFIKVDA